MGDALELQVLPLGRPVVEKEDGAPLADEKLLQGQDLPAVAQRTLGEKPQLRKRVEDEPGRPNPLEDVNDHPDRLGELYFRGIVHGHLHFRLEVLFSRGKFQDLDPPERPAVRHGPRGELLLALRKGDVEAAVALAHALEEELEAERGLARPRVPLDQVEAAWEQAPSEDVVNPGDADGDALGR